jgi:SAM-dependent methyltransferase
MGHRVVGIDTSPTMLAAAKEKDPSITICFADAAALPLANGSFDCVVAFMSLQDVDDFRRAIGETARVLHAGGRMCMAIVHPLNSAGEFANEDPESPFVIAGSYLEPNHYEDNIVRDGMEMTFVSAHRPLSAYAEALHDAGSLIERMKEPAFPERAIAAPRQRRWQRVPLFLHLRALKP